MPKSGYTGISFPFRVTLLGGVAMSTTGVNNAKHIEESIRQILSTNYLERVMEPNIFSRVEEYLFEPDDESLLNVLRFRMVEDITRLDDRVMLDEDDISFSVEDTTSGRVLFATLHYNVVKYETSYSLSVPLGEVA